jgi:hypothetical protein
MLTRDEIARASRTCGGGGETFVIGRSGWYAWIDQLTTECSSGALRVSNVERRRLR